jgi:hypothetical protein
MLFPIATPIFFSPKSKAMTFVLGRMFDEGAISNKSTHFIAVLKKK